MGYWLKKRNISLVTAIFTIRNIQGKTINVVSYEISECKSYVFKGSSFFKNTPEDFHGSVEIEIFSAVDMVFPYPAITFAIKSLNGLTFVHTCGRVYNDFNDFNINNEQVVPETGFDVILKKNYNPFFSFVNGPKEILSERFQLEFIDTDGKKITENREIRNIKSYGLVIVNLIENENIRSAYKDEKITVKIKHDFKGFFPRFVVGNIYKDFSDISLSHSYYDNSVDESKLSIFQNPKKNIFYDAVTAVPVNNIYDKIELAVYPNFSNSPFNLIFHLFDSRGNKIEECDKTYTITNKNQKLLYISFKEIFKKIKNLKKTGMVKVIADGNGKVPSRIKFGLNISRASNWVNLPSNICFNANLPNIKILSKPGTFKWCPIFDVQNQSVYLHNLSFVKNGFGEGDLKIQVYREKDKKVLEWDQKISECQTVDILLDKSKEINEFLGNSIGWITINSTNPFIIGYYLTDFGKGVIGADHIF